MDRGWGVAVAASFAAFFTVVMMTNSGFFYVSFMEEFSVDRSSASWPASAMSLIAHCTGLLVAVAQRRLSVFCIGMVGSFFLWVGILGAVWAPNIAWMTVTLGVIHGAGVGTIVVTLINVVMMYFDKYRGTASGLKFAGYSMCSLLYPIILTTIKDAYGFRGALLMYAGLSMNVTALTFLLKEPPWLRTQSSKCKKRSTTPERHENEAPLQGTVSSPHSLAAVQLRVPLAHARDTTGNLHFLDTPEPLRVNSGTYLTERTKSTNTMHAYWPNNIEYLASMPLRSNIFTTNSVSKANFWTLETARLNSSISKTASIDKPRASNKAKTGCDTGGPHSTGLSSLDQRIIPNKAPGNSLLHEVLLLLASPRFYVFVVAVAAVDYTMAVFPATIIDYALDKGSARFHADLAVTYCAPAELLGRVVLPVIGDHRIVSRTTLVTACFFTLAAALLALPATSSFVSYILVCSGVTMMLGCLMSMKPVIIADHFGIATVAISYGIAGVALLPLLLCNPIITGYFRDTKGSYDGLCQLQAGINGFVGCLFAILAVVDGQQWKQWKKKEAS